MKPDNVLSNKVSLGPASIDVSHDIVDMVLKSWPIYNG